MLVRRLTLVLWLTLVLRLMLVRRLTLVLWLTLVLRLTLVRRVTLVLMLVLRLTLVRRLTLVLMVQQSVTRMQTAAPQKQTCLMTTGRLSSCSKQRPPPQQWKRAMQQLRWSWRLTGQQQVMSQHPARCQRQSWTVQRPAQAV
jgi:hypothetical protein